MSALISLFELIPADKQAEAYNHLCDVISFPTERRRLKVHMVQSAVRNTAIAAAEAWGVTVTALNKRSRKAPLVYARMFIYNHLHKNYRLSDTSIGEIFNYDRSSVNYALTSFSNLLRFDAEFQHRHKQFLQLINDKPSITPLEIGNDSRTTPTDVLIHRTVNH